MSQRTIPDLPVTVAIPVRNDADNLRHCLPRLKRFAEVVVIDSGSSDSTVDIANEHCARVIQFNWNGRYPKKRNWFLINHSPEQEWVLFLDADEFIDDAFCDALAAELVESDKNAYWLTYDNYFLGRLLRHGVPQRKMALLRVGKALYEKIEEHRWSSLDMEIHEHPIVEGEVGQIGARIEHRDDRGIGHFVSKHRDYAAWEARRYELLRNDPGVWQTMTDRQRFKYRNIGKWWFPILYFLAAYFAKLGFLDRAAGFHYALLKAWYFYIIRLLMAENKKKGQGHETI